jgi:hypothetical protein
MNENAPRSICLALLMITMTAVPLLDAPSEPPELRDDPVKMQGTINGGTCTGHDACRGSDAGNTYATAHNLTSDFDFDGNNETNVYFGSHTATGYSTTSDANNDMFVVDVPPGYGFTATLTWNHSGQGSYIYSETYAYYLSVGPTSMSGYSTSATSSFGGAWAYCRYSNAGELKTTNENYEMYEGNTATGTGYCYKASSSYSTYTDTPHDLAGDTFMLNVWCYRCYQNTYTDYQLEITVWPGDAGKPGDQTTPLTGAPLTQIGGGWYWGSGGSPSGTSWSSISDTFTLAAGQEVGLDYECDYWCPYETAVSLTAPNGTSYSWGVGSLAGYSSGSLGAYSGAGTWTLSATDSYGDGGILLTVAESLGSFTGMLTADAFNTEDKKSGFVSSSDTSDVWAMTIPDGYAANITLDWPANADLDIYIYQNADLTGLLAYSWYDQPEFIDLGGSVTNTTVFIKVEYWYWGSVDPSAGYLLWMQITPSVNPPCWVQNDGGSGDDAGDSLTEATNVSSNGMQGTLTGMICEGYDDYDYYLLDVPAYYGAWARLDWGEQDGGGTGSTIASGDNRLWMYMYTSSGSYIMGSTSYYRNPHALSTNNSYTWNYQLSSPSQVVIYVRAYDIADDFELNYTIQYSIYNQSVEPTQSSNPNDAGTGQDGGDSFYGTDAPTINSMNQTFTGWAHDSWDRYDYYKVYIPNNYALMINLTFPEENWLYLGIYYPSATGYLYSACYVSTSNTQGWLTCSIDYSYAGQDMFIRIYNSVGGGEYSVEMTMITPDNEPGAPHNDCGTGIDASDNIYSHPGGNTWLNDSTQIDANGDANDTAGTCTGWLDENWDPRDYYNILVPSGKYLMMNVSWESDGQYIYTYMYKCQIQTLPCGYPANPAYFVSQQSSNAGSTSGISGLWVTQGGWLTIGIYTYGASMITYTMDLQFRDLSELPGGVQDDAGSGVDAGAGPSDAVHVDNYNNWTANDTLEFSGWNHGSVDTTDRYTFDVPANFGYEVCVSHEGIQYYNGGYTVWIILDIFGTGTGNIAYGQPIYSSSTICWNSSTTGGYYGDALNMIGVRNWGGAFIGNEGQDYNVTISFYSLDADGDGWYDSMENLCGTDPFDNTSVPQDTDADGICDLLDTDTDGDGVIDSEDAFPEDANESTDSDGDGIGDNSDWDLDNDGWNNTDEVDCLTDPMDGSSFPEDFDNDTICDVLDSDDDNDGYFDNDDRFPYNASEWADNDNDGVGDNADEDDDNDGYSDAVEIECQSSPTEVTDIPVDSDLDGICDAIDDDVDGDGYDNDVDAFPTDPDEWSDFDGDGIGDNADTDDDNDLVLDVDDAFPYDPYETVDTDGDGVGDNGDLNDDGDAWTDAEEAACGSDSLDADSVPDDYDGDGLCDKVDTDDDGDGTPDTDDAFPFDATEYADFDGDGIGDFSDTDDDNDGWLDSEEPNCGTDPMDTFSVPDDNDRDKQCDIVDPDDDNDGTLDIDDDFPMNPAEQNDLDGDGYGDNADNDDDGDGWLDVTEAICAAAGGYGDSMNANVMPRDNDPGVDATAGEDGIWGTDDDTGTVGDLVCDAIDPDWDNDGFPNPADPEAPVCTDTLCEDTFPYDPTEWHDANGDGLGDNGEPLGFMDDFQAEPAPFIAALLAIIGMIAIVRRGMGAEDEDDFDEDADFTEEFMDDDELDEAVDEAFEDEDED